jgi:hypothetical protein
VGSIATSSRLDFWRAATVIAPFAGAAIPFFGVLLLGGFDDFQMVGKEPSALGTFGLLGTMLFPFAAYQAAKRNYGKATNALARSWPTAPATIRSSAIERRMTGWASALWALDVEYSYTVDGRSRTATTLGFAPRFINDKDLIFRCAEKYKEGAVVPARYDPDSPDLAVLETDDAFARGNDWRFWLTFTTPFLLALFMAIRHV